MPPQAPCRLCGRDSGIEEGAQKPSSVQGHEAEAKVLSGFSLLPNLLLLQKSGYWAKVVHPKVSALRPDGKAAI
jgi:hypothetical protein